MPEYEAVDIRAPQPISAEEMAGLLEIQRLLDEAYRNYFAKGDGHCKSSEGWIELGFNNFFQRQHDKEPFRITQVGVYSYVFGPSRMHHFGSVAEALSAVRRWHAEEMARDYEDFSGMNLALSKFIAENDEYPG